MSVGRGAQQSNLNQPWENIEGTTTQTSEYKIEFPPVLSGNITVSLYLDKSVRLTNLSYITLSAFYQLV